MISRRAECHICFRMVVVRQDGCLRFHNDHKDLRCSASGRSVDPTARTSVRPGSLSLAFFDLCGQNSA